MTFIFDLIIFGLYNGSVWALMALGFSLVYGVGGIMNLAHGMLYLFTGYLIIWLIVLFPAGLAGHLGAYALAVVIMAIIGAMVYLVAIKPVEDKPVTILIMTFALALFLEQLIRIVVGSTINMVPTLVKGTINVEGTTVSIQSLVVMLASVIIVVVFTLFLKKTKVGNSIRAISQDRDAARLMGINVNRYLMYTLMISTLLAALAAGVSLNNLLPEDGTSYLIVAFGVVILGGLGSLEGSVIAAYIQGFVAQYVVLTFGTAYSGIVPGVVIVLILIIRPRGLFGKKERS